MWWPSLVIVGMPPRCSRIFAFSRIGSCAFTSSAARQRIYASSFRSAMPKVGLNSFLWWLVTLNAAHNSRSVPGAALSRYRNDDAKRDCSVKTSSGRADLAPRGHRRGAEHAVCLS
jgi:hypothetical protein